MNQKPHYMLFAESHDDIDFQHGQKGIWRFLLEARGSSQRFEASDVEYGINGERLALLAVVRGLEALNQPSHVTLITSSDHVRRGFRYGLDQWRADGWQWERFGQQVPIKDHDLWQRVDRAARIHQIECRVFRFDQAHEVHARPAVAARRIRPELARRPASRSRSWSGICARVAASWGRVIRSSERLPEATA